MSDLETHHASSSMTSDSLESAARLYRHIARTIGTALAAFVIVGSLGGNVSSTSGFSDTNAFIAFIMTGSLGAALVLWLRTTKNGLRNL